MRRLWLALALLLAPVARAADVPPAQQALLALKVASYDRRVEDSTDDFVFKVLYRNETAASRTAAQDLYAALRDLEGKVSVKGRTVVVELVPWKGDASVVDGASAVFVAPALDSSLPAIIDAAAATGALTLCAERDIVERGLAVGILESAGRPALLVNLAGAKAVGADFPASFLSMAEVLR